VIAARDVITFDVRDQPVTEGPRSRNNAEGHWCDGPGAAQAGYLPVHDPDRLDSRFTRRE